MEERPVGSVRIAGLDQRDLRLIGFVLRHSDYNRFAYRLEDDVARRADTPDADLALANLHDPEGEELFAALDAGGADSERVEVVPRGVAATSADAVALDRLAQQLLPVLNRVFERRLAEREALAARTRDAGLRSPASGEGAQAGAGVGGGDDEMAGRGDAPARVLVVDDSATVRRQLGVALDRLGLRHEAADSAAQALERLAVETFDLVLVDVMMPGTDGYRLTREIRRDRRTRHLAVIILTSRSSPFDLARGALAGCDAYLTKPVPFRALESAVHKQLRRAPRAAARTSDAGARSGDPGPGVENSGASRLSRLLGR